MGVYDDTIIMYFSDHGSHFRTRNRDENKCGYDDYKRTGHSAALKIPLVIGGGAVKQKKVVKDLVSTASLTKTIIALTGIDVGDAMIGENLMNVADGTLPGRKNEVFAQISESRVGRVLRTEEYLLGVVAKGLFGGKFKDADRYIVDYFYDLKLDPLELMNRKDDESYHDVIRSLCDELETVIHMEEHKESKIKF